jgi:hypothetical protein
LDQVLQPQINRQPTVNQGSLCHSVAQKALCSVEDAHDDEDEEGTSIVVTFTGTLESATDAAGPYEVVEGAPGLSFDSIGYPLDANAMRHAPSGGQWAVWEGEQPVTP